MALPRGTTGSSAVCDFGIPDHTHLLFFKHKTAHHQSKLALKF